jgi:hypothetical protein
MDEGGSARVDLRAGRAARRGLVGPVEPDPFDMDGSERVDFVGGAA